MLQPNPLLSYYISSNIDLEPLKQGLIKCCDDNNLSVLKIIEAKNEYDHEAFIKLCHSVRRENNNQPITLIIDENSFENFSYFLSWMVIGVLLEAKLIDRFFVWEKNIVYEPYSYKNYRVLSKPERQGAKNNLGEGFTLDSELSLLKICFLHMKKIVSLAKKVN